MSETQVLKMLHDFPEKTLTSIHQNKKSAVAKDKLGK